MAWAWTSNVGATSNSITLVVILENHRRISDYGPIYITLNGQQSSNLNYQHWSGQAHWSSEYTFYGLSPGTSYYASMTIGGSPGDGGYYYTISNPVPPTPSFSQSSASGTSITMYLRDYGTATSVNYYTSWNGSWSYYNSIQSYPYFNAPDYGGSYEIWVQGNNAQGTSDTKKAYAYSAPYVPYIWVDSIVNNKVTIGITTQGYFDRIDVGMYTATGQWYTTKSITYDYNYYRTAYVSFSDLAPGSKWSFKVLSYGPGGYNSGYGNEPTVTNNVKPATPTASHHSSSGTSIAISVGNDTNTTKLWFKPSWSTTWVERTPNQGTYSFTAPQYGTEYTIAVYAEGAGGDSAQKIAYVMSEPRVPSLQNLGIAKGELSLRVTNSGEFTQIKLEMFPKGSATAYSTRYINWTGDTTLDTTVTFTNLVPQSSYDIIATVTKNAVNYSYSPTLVGGRFAVTYTVAKPAIWQWYTTKTVGGVFSMSATEWNAFTTRINQFREYKGLDAYNFTQAYSGSGFEFQMHNETRAAINAMANTGVGIVSRGSSIQANALNILRNTLNTL